MTESRFSCHFYELIFLQIFKFIVYINIEWAVVIRHKIELHSSGSICDVSI